MAEPQRLLTQAGGGLCDLRGSPGCRGYESGQGLELGVSRAGGGSLPLVGGGSASFLLRTPCSVNKSLGGTYCVPGHGPVPVGHGVSKAPSAGSLPWPAPSCRSLHAAPR